MRGGQRPFGTFTKIHPFLKGQASLSTSKNSSDCSKPFYGDLKLTKTDPTGPVWSPTGLVGSPTGPWGVPN